MATCVKFHVSAVFHGGDLSMGVWVCALCTLKTVYPTAVRDSLGDRRQKYSPFDI